MRKVRGFTLVELLTVIGIAAILMMVAVPSFTKVIATQRLKAAASNLQVALYTARSEGIKRNVDVCITTSSTSCTPANAWNQGWYVRDTSSGNVIATFPPYANLTITGPTVSLSYQSSGRISITGNGSGLTAPNYFKVSSSSVTDVKCVNIATSGAPSVTSSGC
jgi:type IV fimbrial biogenesis protein FimT